jgi:hypothetical protein
MREFDSAASWRRDDMKLSHWDLLQRIVQLGKKPSTLMGAPGLTVSMFLFDWLHAADLGITGDFWEMLCGFFWQNKQAAGTNHKGARLCI